MRMVPCVCVLLLCSLGCARSPQREPPEAIYQWFLESDGPQDQSSRRNRNLLVTAAVSGDADVLVALQCVLRYGLAGSPEDTLCFLGFGLDDGGEWLDPPEGLIEGLSDLPLALVPVSESGLAPVPLAGEFWSAPVLQPAVPGARCTLELREWEAGSRAVVHIHVVAQNGRSAESRATLRKVDGVWSIREWRGGRVWSPN